MKTQIAKEFMSLLKHASQNLIAALVILAMAIIFAKLEEWCAKENFPAYIIYGVRMISVFLFIIDGIVICGTCLILAVKVLQQQSKLNKHED